MKTTAKSNETTAKSNETTAKSNETTAKSNETTPKSKKPMEKLRFIDLYENRFQNENDWEGINEFLEEIADDIGSFISASSSNGYLEAHMQKFMADMCLGAARFKEYTRKENEEKA
jgi:hypothetical protein